MKSKMTAISSASLLALTFLFGNSSTPILHSQIPPAKNFWSFTMYKLPQR